MNVSDAQRLEELERAVVALREAAAGNAVIVEGKRDIAALEALGVGGTHIMINRGDSIEVFIDRLAEQAGPAHWTRLVLLTDWDRTGGRLFRRLWEGLRARFPVDVECRRRLAKASHVRCVEHVPSELATLRGGAGRTH